MGFYAVGALLMVGLLFSLSSCSQPQTTHDYKWSLPPNLPPPEVPSDNPMTYAKVALGRALFYEPALSGNRAMSCSTCHMIEHAFSEPRITSSGSTGGALKRNALALVNIAYNSDFTWAHNGLASIEQQMLIPLFSESPVEMGVSGNQKAVLVRFNTADYQRLFNKAYGDNEITLDRMVKAIASFVRSLTSFDSPFDDYAYRQQDNALNNAELRGLELFFSERTECFHCHGGFNFTQSSKHPFQPLDLRPFHNTGLYNTDGKGSYPNADKGLIEVTLNEQDMGRFKAPTLRNVALSAPYMHDGSIATLPEVIDFYAQGGRTDGIISPLKSQFMPGFALTNDEADDLLAFLNSLSDQSFINKPENHAPINPPAVK
ncbi:MAG: cytochrome c peroxidase [Alphaproteobacteria bacterium]|jgi:cytochrome c peroxidase